MTYFRDILLGMLVMSHTSLSQGIHQLDSLFDKYLDPEQEEGALPSDLDEFGTEYGLPLDLNTLDLGNPVVGMIFTTRQVLNIQDHVKTYGPLQSIYELQSVEGFELGDLQRIRPFVAVESSTGFEYDNRWRGFVSTRIERLIPERSGFDINRTNPFVGSPERLIFRSKIWKGPHFKSAITFEKDSGEPLQWSPDKGWFGADHISGYVAYAGSGLVQQVVAGNFNATWGQGLVVGTGYALKPGRNAIGMIKRNESKLIPTQTLAESTSFNGIGVSLKSGIFQLSSFYSRANVDAAVNEERVITSIRGSGNHRTKEEIALRQNAFVTDYALKLVIKPVSGFHLGVTGISTTFNLPYARIPLTVRDSLYSYGNAIGSVFTEFKRSNYVLFAEWATQKSREKAWIAGALIAFDRHFEGILVARSYSQNFFSYRSTNALGQSSSPKNENGIYWGLRYTPMRNITLGAFVDIFQKPEDPEAGLLSRSGVKYLASFEMKPDKNLRVRALFRANDRERPLRNDTIPMARQVKSSKYQFKIDSEVIANQFLILTSGVGYSWSRQPMQDSDGVVIYQDVTVKNRIVKISSRVALIDSDYENRFYLFEKELYRSILVPSYSGKAMKYYLVVAFRIRRHLNLSVKWSHIRYHDRKVIGSGLEQINGSAKSSLKGQIYYSF